jgi:hypothetical protein
MDLREKIIIMIRSEVTGLLTIATIMTMTVDDSYQVRKLEVRGARDCMPS